MTDEGEDPRQGAFLLGALGSTRNPELHASRTAGLNAKINSVDNAEGHSCRMPLLSSRNIRCVAKKHQYSFLFIEQFSAGKILICCGGRGGRRRRGGSKRRGGREAFGWRGILTPTSSVLDSALDLDKSKYGITDRSSNEDFPWSTALAGRLDQKSESEPRYRITESSLDENDSRTAGWAG